MKLYVLDPDMLTLFEEGHTVVVERVRAAPPESICTTIISVQEQLDGWNDRLPQAKNQVMLAGIYLKFTQTVQFLSRLHILSFEIAAIERFDGLKRAKLNIGKMDLRIAASATAWRRSTAGWPFSEVMHSFWPWDTTLSMPCWSTRAATISAG
jgi:tRNA(fMet)-specific endonuclease VapC